MTKTNQTEELNTAEIVCNMVRDHDHDRYRLIILAPSKDQGRLFALAAFNSELSQCMTNTDEPMLAVIKLQWWHDTISDAIDGKFRKHPVITELSKYINDFNSLLPLIKVRQDESEKSDRPSLQSTIDYAKATSGYLHQLMLNSEDKAIGDAATKLGTAWGLINLLRGIIFQGAAQSDLVPSEVMDKFDGEKTFKGDIAVVFETAAQSILSIVEDDLVTVKKLRKSISLDTSQKALMKLSILAEHYIQAIKKGQFDPAQINFDKGQFTLLLKLMFKSG